MRFSLTIISLLLAPLALAIETPSRSLNTHDDLSPRAEGEDSLAASFQQGQAKGWGWGNGGHHGGHGGKQCKGNPLRDQKDKCHCKPGLIEVFGNCCCGDQSNTLLTLQGCGGNSGCDKPVCECKPEHSHYDKNKHKCVCEPGYKPTWNSDGKLKCEPPQPSGEPYRQARRELAAAIHERKQQGKRSDVTPVRTLEEIMRCQVGEKACQNGPAYACIDIASNLASCGACPGEAEDCSSLPGVDQVRCEEGRCVVDTCLRGFTLIDNDVPANSSQPASICKSSRSVGSPYLQVQKRDAGL